MQTEVSPFCILPPQPTQDVSPSGSEVGKVTQHLKALKAGNPGSGNSQLARLTAKRLFDEGKETPYAIPIVRTLKAESSALKVQLGLVHRQLGDLRRGTVGTEKL